MLRNDILALVDGEFYRRKEDAPSPVLESRTNTNCVLARNGFKPYERCDYCTLHAPKCMGMQFNFFTFAISFATALFLFLDDPILIRINIIVVIGLLFWLGYKITLNTDELARTSNKNNELSLKLQSHKESLEDEVKRRTIQLEKMAKQDTITGLNNRFEFERQLKMVMKDAKNEKAAHVLCYIDLDQFKIVNDTVGHIAGDELLRQVSLILKRAVRDQDVLARLGGDEFGIIYIDADIEMATKMAEQLLRHIKEYRFQWKGNTFAIGASIGMVGITRECCTLTNLLSQADTACYAAKDGGRNRIHIALPADSAVEERREQMQWIARLEEALVEERFELYAQPIVAIQDNGGLSHYEILLRLHDVEGNVVPPMAFIPAAERYGFMSKLDRWVIEKSFQNYATMRDNGMNNVNFSINISGVSFADEGMTNFIMRAFDLYDIPCQNITFEITESAAIANLNSALEFIEAFKDLGCHFSLDDFGCGLSSFSYLQNMPVDYLKIDGSFVVDIDTNEVNRAMVEAINKIGHVMGIRTICEYVESKEVMDILKAMNVDYVQGYFAGVPISMKDIGLTPKVTNASA